MKLKAQLMFDPTFGNAINKIWSTPDLPLQTKLAVADFKKKMTEIAAPINEEVTRIRSKYIDKTTQQIPEELHDEFNKEWEANIANVELDFGTLLPLPDWYNAMTWESALFKSMSADELSILDSHGIISIDNTRNNMKISMV